ncbi:MAG: lytic transglycosylase domain-containing protein [Candidatus Rokuibacteriota bacterium]
MSAAILSLAVIATPAAAGSTYRFEDGEGVVHYTNVPSDPRYGFVRRDPEPERAKPATDAGGSLGRGVRAFAHLIRTTAERHGVDARLVEAIVQTESAGNPTAVSPKGARGLMQLMPERAAELGVRDSFDPVQNVDGGVRHMRDLLQRFGGDVTLALAAYNAGETAVRTYGGIPPYAETREYVRRVRSLYEGAGPAMPGAIALVTAPQRIYRAIADDGTLTFTNLPPRTAAPAGRF